MPVRYESPTIRNAVAFLGLTGILSVLGMIGLAWEKVEIPTALATAAGAAIGSIGTLLTTFTPSPVPGGRRAADVPVTVETGDHAPSTQLPPGTTLQVQQPSAEGGLQRGTGN